MYRALSHLLLDFATHLLRATTTKIFSHESSTQVRRLHDNLVLTFRSRPEISRSDEEYVMRRLKLFLFLCFVPITIFFVQSGTAREDSRSKETIEAQPARLSAGKAPEIVLTANFQSPCANAVEHALPLPTSVSPSQFVAYEQQILAFLRSGGYRTQLNWCGDKGIRDTGPFQRGVYYGTHPAVRVYYSPRVMDWLVNGRNGEIPDGAMIVKEQFEPPATRYAGLREDQLPVVRNWTIMIKDKKGSHDGWFWGDFFEGMTFDDDSVPFQYPQAGFGIACLRCHASADRESTFITTNNIKGFPGSPLTYADDGSWRSQTQVSYFNLRHGSRAIPIALSEPVLEPTVADPEFLRQFPAIGEVARSEVQKMPSETYDYVASPGVGAPGFVSSSNCMHCHGGLTGPLGTVMFLPSVPAIPGVLSGANISPYGEWRWSPMALSGRDPIFHSQLEGEVAWLSTLPPPRREEAVVTTRNTCMSCHGVMGKRQFDTDTGGTSNFLPSFLQITDRSDPNFKYGALAREGISCTVCHRSIETETPEGVHPLTHFLNTSINGKFKVGPDKEIYGPYDEVIKRPMENSVQMKPLQNAYISSSRMCGSCHTIDLPVIDGAPGQHSIEQATYLEWLNSKFQNEFVSPLGSPPSTSSRSCQSCHLPGGIHNQKKGLNLNTLDQKMAAILDESYPAVENALELPERTVKVRNDYKRHELVGMNVFLLEMFNQFWDLLGVRRPLPNTSVGNDYMTGSKTGLLDAIDNMVDQAQSRTVRLSVEARVLTARQVQADVSIENLAGHRFPTGVGFRRAFIELLVADKYGDIVWASGLTNRLGVILGSDGKPLPSEFHTSYVDEQGRVQQSFQPHYQAITSQDQVQIYEELTTDALGKFTTSFLRRDHILKDNRLLPAGWTREGPHPALSGRFLEATYPVGEGVEYDPDYNDGRGKDKITYLMTFPAGVDLGRCTVQATLFYQATPPRYLNDRFTNAPNGDATKRLYYLASNLNLDGTNIESWKLRVAQKAAGVVGAPLICNKFCTRSARYYLSRLNNLPKGIVRIAGSSPDTRISTQASAHMKLALDGGSSIRDQFNAQFVAFQLSMLAAEPLGDSTLNTQLICWTGNFAPVPLSIGHYVGPQVLLREFLDQISSALNERRDKDLAQLTIVLAELNGNDPQGACVTP
jgi:hypothetical protein